jgi:predicted DNA-binding protein (UPF0251 family)
LADRALRFARISLFVPDHACGEVSSSGQCKAIVATPNPSLRTCGSPLITKDKPPKLAAIIADVSDEAEPSDGGHDHPERVSLNDREAEMLRCLVQGMAKKEIAGRMEISESAVKEHVATGSPRPMSARAVSWFVSHWSSVGDLL